jgi:Fe2+ or Zn2+ uptake regulation protein
MLAKIVYEIVQTHKGGVKHSEVVTEVLRRGYKHCGEHPLSDSVYDILKNLVTCGTISRFQDESLERRYSTVSTKDTLLCG